MTKELKELSLCSGMCGMTLALRLANIPARTIGYVESDPYCQRLIRRRIQDGFLDWAPIIRDIRAADFRPMAGLVDIVTAGFPCQSYSVAGKRLSASDERDLWPDVLRCIREVGPKWVLLENVRGLCDGLSPYSAQIVGQLSQIGYDSEWGLLPAAAVGAPHLRWRWFLISYSKVYGLQGEAGDQQEIRRPYATGEDWWSSEPSVGRMAHGVAHRMDRLKALRNGLVPAVGARVLDLLLNQS